jgi:hypothetical protein
LPFRFPQELNTLRANVFQKLLVKYCTGKVQYQDLKKKLEELSGKLGTPCFKNFATVLPALTSLFLDFASLIVSLESQLANSMSADAVELLKQRHAEELQGLQAQSARA